jgi:MFS transporter, PAT family, solute carrier family 33 (acetyl-CoA transportor), member 1
MQGIPLGLVFGSIPYMLKSEKSNTLSYSQFGLFSLAGYPYSLKLIWSPLVDQIYSRKLGRRKSWILPVQSLVGVLFYVLGRRIDQWIVPGKPVNFWRLNGCFLALVTLCATLDVAVDGWALTLLPSDKIHFASTCQSVGVNVGLFISFTIFLAFSSARFCKEFLGISKELFTLGSFMRFWAVIYLLFTGLLLLKGEKEEVKQQGNKNNTPQIKNNNTQVNSDNTQVNSDNPQINSDNPQVKQGNNNDNPTTNSANTRPSTISSIVKGYKTLWGIITLPTVRSFALILLSFKFGFSAYDAVAPLKLLEKGFPKEFLALTVLIDFPFQMIMGFFVAKWSAGPRTFRPVNQKEEDNNNNNVNSNYLLVDNCYLF